MWCTLHETLSNKIQFHIQGTINYYQVKTVLEMQEQFKMRKSMYIIHFSKKSKEKNSIISSINIKKLILKTLFFLEGKSNQLFCNMLIFIQFNLIIKWVYSKGDISNQRETCRCLMTGTDIWVTIGIANMLLHIAHMDKVVCRTIYQNKLNIYQIFKFKV